MRLIRRCRVPVISLPLIVMTCPDIVKRAATVKSSTSTWYPAILKVASLYVDDMSMRKESLSSFAIAASPYLWQGLARDVGARGEVAMSKGGGACLRGLGSGKG